MTDETANQGESFYFAYGSNMDASQMGIRCEGAIRSSVARLDGHRFRINRGGVATVVAEPGAVVFGCLWRVTAAHLAELDRYEGVARGVYERLGCVVGVDGSRYDALIYVAADRAPGRPRAGYLDRIVAAAEALGLPDDYLRELDSWR